MKSAFGMFVLTKREQRVVVVIVFALIAIALAKHYRETETITPAQPTTSSEVSATPANVGD
jgi:hypothetical protein